jgi:hypothetical protein
MAYVILLLLLVGVVWLVSAPLRHAAGTPSDDRGWEPMQRLDLQAARDAKYREIRDAELDHQTGKLSEADYEAIDSSLRAEAIELLHQLDAIDEEQESWEDEAPDSE